jgi:hypothetical protein
MSNRLKLKVRTKIPAALREGQGISITKDGLAYQVGLEYSQLQEVSSVDADNSLVAVEGRDGVWQAISPNNLATSAAAASAAAYTLKGNATGVLAPTTDIDITALPAKASTVAADIVLIQDSAAGNAFKKTTVAGLAAAAVAGVSSYNGLSGSVAGFAADKVFFVSTSGNDSKNGLSPETAKLTLQAAITAASGGGTVYVGSGTYTLSAALVMAPGVKLVGAPGTTITQANGANLANLITFGTGPATGSSIEGCVIDGNRAGNTDDVSVITVKLGTASDVAIRNCTLQNSNGTLLALDDSFRARVFGNTVTNFYVIGISAVASSIQTNSRATISENTFLAPMGQHTIYLKWSDNNAIINNTIVDNQTIGVVNTSGTTVSWVSGSNFANVTPGNFITINTVEYLVTAKASSISLTVNSTAGTQSSKAYIAGTGDMISVGNASFNLIQGNRLYGGGAGGIVLHQFYGSSNAQGNMVQNNHVQNSAQACISAVSSTLGGATQIVATTISDNYVVDGGRGSTAVDATVRSGISVIDGGTALNVLTTVRGNFIRDTNSTSSYGIITSGLTAGFTFAGNNTIYNATNSGIQNALGTVTLTGWGSGATVTEQVSVGSNFYFKITPGTTPSANPTIAISTRVSSVNQPPLYKCKAYDNNGGAVPLIGDVPPGAASGFTLTAQGFTPTAGVPVVLSAVG